MGRKRSQMALLTKASALLKVSGCKSNLCFSIPVFSSGPPKKLVLCRTCISSSPNFFFLHKWKLLCTREHCVLFTPCYFDLKVHSLTEGSLVHVHSPHSHKNVPPDPATNWNNCFTMNQQIGGCHARACLSLSPCYSSLVVVHMGETLVMIKTGLIYHHGHRYDIYIFIQYLDLHYIYVAIYINYISCMYL